jgi:uncharacterized membrane protein
LPPVRLFIEAATRSAGRERGDRMAKAFLIGLVIAVVALIGMAVFVIEL